jgi:Flp pilus assembly protein TadD
MNDHITVGESHLKAGRLPEALRSFELAMEFAPHDHRAIYFSALVHLKLGQEATALLLFNRALELDHDNATYLSDLAVTKVRLGDKHGAMHDLDRCVQLEPDNSFRYSLRAFVRNSMGNVQGAIDDYNRAIELDPEDTIAINNLGMAEESFGYNESAQQHFALADKLSGITSAPKDHTIELSGRANSKAPADVSHAEEQVMPDESFSFRYYLDTVKRVITDKKVRDDFFRFAGGLIKTNTK